MQRKLLLITVCVLLPASALGASAETDVAYSKRWIQGVPVHVVTANLNSPRVKVSAAIARHGVGSSEGFGSMLARLQPAAAITGTYFCVRSMRPVGDVVVGGKLVAFGSVGTAICFTPHNEVDFRPAAFARSTGWNGYETVVCGGPRLVSGGMAYVAPRAEGFTDGGFFVEKHRSAIGVTKHNKLLMVTVNRPIYLSRMARIMRDLGAVNAISLDGGSSTALFYRGHVFSHPGRRLTNLIVVYDSPQKFARIKPRLAPSPVLASTRSKS